MRLAVFLTMMVVGLAAFGLSRRVEVHSGGPPVLREVNWAQGMGGPKRSGSKPGANKNPSWTVQGMGKTKTDAEQDALEKAQTELILFLRQQTSLEWTPSVSYINAKLVKERKEEALKDFAEPVGPMRQVSLEVELTPEARAEMSRLDRHYRMEHRLPLVARILGALVALLVAVTSYVRLDELSKGYYKGWLRLAATAFVAAAWAGLLRLT
jgi:hypothetical protein